MSIGRQHRLDSELHRRRQRVDGATARIVEQLEQSGLEEVMLDGVRPVEAVADAGGSLVAAGSRRGRWISNEG